MPCNKKTAKNKDSSISEISNGQAEETESRSRFINKYSSKLLEIWCE